MTFHKHHTKADGGFAEKLQEDDVLDRAKVLRAKALSEAENISFARSVLKLGFLDEDKLLLSLSEHLSISYVSSESDFNLSTRGVDVLTLDYCLTHSIAPIELSDGTAKLLISEPDNLALVSEIGFFLGDEQEIVATPSRVIKALLETASMLETTTTHMVSDAQIQADQTEFKRQEGDGPVIRFVSSVLKDAVEKGASDIHFEAQEAGLRVRLRINGTLNSISVPNELSTSSILARIKVVSSMNVSERRLPQDGRLTTNIAGRKIDFRVSSVPTSFGESIVCRVLDPNSLRLGWEKLGFDKAIAKSVIELIEQPSGLFLVTGPTGSGKTTTLYTALSHLNHEGRKILTVEDPIEYNLEGVEQVQVHEEVGMTFARALRSFLRQDPNIIMVGEIRDEETAEIACRAALVGRMVLSTMHTNSPEGALTRLTDLGVPEYIVKDVLRGVLGQSLSSDENSHRSLTAALFVPHKA